jgi:predicted small lipoprotein YifL
MNKKVGLIAILATALILGACGRKGPPEPPPSSAVPAEQNGEQPEPTPKRNSFFLDFLI